MASALWLWWVLQKWGIGWWTTLEQFVLGETLEWRLQPSLYDSTWVFLGDSDLERSNLALEDAPLLYFIINPLFPMLLPCRLRIHSVIILYSKMEAESSKSLFLFMCHIFASPVLLISFIFWSQGWHYLETPHCEQRTLLLSYQWLLHLASTRIRGREGGADIHMPFPSQRVERFWSEYQTNSPAVSCSEQGLCPFSEPRDSSASSMETMNDELYLYLHCQLTSYFQYLHQGRKHYPNNYKTMWFDGPYLISWKKPFSWNWEHYSPKVGKS